MTPLSPSHAVFDYYKPNREFRQERKRSKARGNRSWAESRGWRFARARSFGMLRGFLRVRGVLLGREAMNAGPKDKPKLLLGCPEVDLKNQEWMSLGGGGSTPLRRQAQK